MFNLSISERSGLRFRTEDGKEVTRLCFYLMDNDKLQVAIMRYSPEDVHNGHHLDDDVFNCFLKVSKHLNSCRCHVGIKLSL